MPNLFSLPKSNKLTIVERGARDARSTNPCAGRNVGTGTACLAVPRTRHVRGVLYCGHTDTYSRSSRSSWPHSLMTRGCTHAFLTLGYLLARTVRWKQPARAVHHARLVHTGTPRHSRTRARPALPIDRVAASALSASVSTPWLLFSTGASGQGCGVVGRGRGARAPESSLRRACATAAAHRLDGLLEPNPTQLGVRTRSRRELLEPNPQPRLRAIQPS